jgi:hypothetical protein
MNHSEIHEALFDNTVRFESVIYLAGALAQADSLPCDLRELLEMEDDATLLQAFPGFPLALRYEEDCLIELAAEWLIDANILGFLVKAATPVMTYHKESDTSYFSWGHYRTRWVYGESMDEVVIKVIGWAMEMRELEKSK